MVVASYVFYGWWDWHYCFLLAGVTVANQMFVVAIAEPRSHAAKRGWCTVAAVVVEPRRPRLLQVLRLLRHNRSTDGFAKFGVNVSPPLLQIILPIGISFFTFQAMSYVIDTYRGQPRSRSRCSTSPSTSRSSPTSSPARSCGPSSSCPSCASGPTPATSRRPDAFRLIVAGMFKKVVVSSFLASAIVDKVFAAPEQPQLARDPVRASTATRSRSTRTSAATPTSPSAARCCSASASRRTSTRPYTRAVAAGLLAPMAHDAVAAGCATTSTSPSAATAAAAWQTYRNLMLTMLIGGLWHGAAWTFVVWGGIHGVGLCVERLSADRRGCSRLARAAATRRRTASCDGWSRSTWCAWRGCSSVRPTFYHGDRACFGRLFTAWGRRRRS